MVCLPETTRGNPLSWNKANNTIAPALATDITPAIIGSYKLPDDRDAVPAFQLLAERYMADEYKPENVASKCGLQADVIRNLAKEIAHVAFQEELTLDIEWTDWAGRKHENMIGRPVSMHAMRGISAHSNGFIPVAPYMCSRSCWEALMRLEVSATNPLPKTCTAPTKTSRQIRPAQSQFTNARTTAWLSDGTRRLTCG